MELFADNWPVVLVALAVAMVVLGVIQRLVKLALMGAVVGVVGVFVWPMVPS